MALTPDVASVAASVTVTLPVYQPAVGVAGTVAVVTGATESTFTMTAAVALSPALSIAVPT